MRARLSPALTEPVRPVEGLHDGQVAVAGGADTMLECKLVFLQKGGCRRWLSALIIPAVGRQRGDMASGRE